MKIKICGLKNREDTQKSYELGAWALGFIFHEKSARYISPFEVRDILRDLQLKGRETVGVFVNETVDTMNAFQKIAGFSTFQLHGEESPEKISRLNGKVIKKINFSDLSKIDSFLKCRPDMTFLVDSPPSIKGEYGGRGKLADWKFAKEVKKKGPLILAGGLCEKNLKEANHKVGPYALDLSSSVEKSPGLKDHKKLISLFSYIKKGEINES